MDIRDLVNQDIQDTETNQETQRILDGVARILKGIEKGGFKRVFPSVPYSNTRAESPSEIMEKIYLEQLPPEDIKQLMNLDMLSFQLPNAADESTDDLRAYYYKEQERLLEKGKAIYTEKVGKAPETAIKDAAEVVDDLTIIEFVYYRQIVLKEDIKGESKALKEDGIEMLVKTAQEITGDLFKLWLKATKQRANKETRAEWLEHLADIIDKKAIEWQLETEEEQAERKKEKRFKELRKQANEWEYPENMEIPRGKTYTRLEDMSNDLFAMDLNGQWTIKQVYADIDKYFLPVTISNSKAATLFISMLPSKSIHPKKLTNWDKRVITNLSSIFEDNNTERLPKTIELHSLWHNMNGGNSKAELTEQIARRLIDTIILADSIETCIEAKDLIGKKVLDNATMGTYNLSVKSHERLLNCRWYEVEREKITNEKTNRPSRYFTNEFFVELFDSSILHRVNKALKQITNIPMWLLDTYENEKREFTYKGEKIKIPNITIESQAIQYFLLENILQMKSKDNPKGWRDSTLLTAENMFDRIDRADLNKKGLSAAERNRKNDLLKIAETFLKYYSSKEKDRFIKGYKVIRTGNGGATNAIKGFNIIP